MTFDLVQVLAIIIIFTASLGFSTMVLFLLEKKSNKEMMKFGLVTIVTFALIVILLHFLTTNLYK